MKEFTLTDELDNKTLFRLGKNAQENHQLIDEADKLDWWFHLSEYASGHCIVEKENLTKEEIIYAANLIKENSKYNNFKKLKICYTQIKNIKKTKKPGEVIILKTPEIITL